MANILNSGLIHAVHTGTDASGYSGRSHYGQKDMHHYLHQLDQVACRNARIDRDGDFVQGRGDGQLIRWPANMYPDIVLVDYVREYHAELLRLNNGFAPDNQLRVRLAIVLGASELGETGLVGAGAVNAARLVDAEQPKKMFELTEDCPLVVIVDDPIYQEYVLRGIRNLRADDYVSMTVKSKENYSRKVWVTAPGCDSRTLQGLGSQGGKRRPRAVPSRNVADSDTASSKPESSLVDSDGESDGRSPKKTTIVVTITVALIAAIATITAALITASNNGGVGPVDRGSQTQTASPPQASDERSSTTGAPSKLWPEVAANRRGVQTFADNMGATSGRGAIPFGKTVQVVCYAPNLSGMSSINAFYLIDGGRWNGTYAPANTFANGDVLGTAGSTDIDPQVPPCEP